MTNSFFDAIGLAGTIGLHIVSGTIVGGLIGYGLDKYFGTSPWLFICFLLMGIFAGFKNMWRDAKIMMKSESKNYDQSKE